MLPFKTIRFERCKNFHLRSKLAVFTKSAAVENFDSSNSFDYPVRKILGARGPKKNLGIPGNVVFRTAVFKLFGRRPETSLRLATLLSPPRHFALGVGGARCSGEGMTLFASAATVRPASGKSRGRVSVCFYFLFPPLRGPALPTTPFAVPPSARRGTFANA